MSNEIVVPRNSGAVSVPAASLQAMVQRASQALALAVTPAEILDAKRAADFVYDAAKAAGRLARAKGAYDDILASVYRAQADALDIEAQAKRRLADEYDEAQDKGVVAGHGHGLKMGANRPDIGDANIGTVLDFGVTSHAIFEARKARDAEKAEPGIHGSIARELADKGYEPTKAAVSREINARLGAYSGDNEWYTPAKYVEMARDVMGTIDVDPASNAIAQKTVQASVHYTAETNGLDKDWRGRLWMNPPYSNPEVQQFTEKAVDEYLSGNVTEAVILTNNSGDTAWHHALAEASAAMCITRGRIRFESPTRASNSPAMGQSFFYLGRNVARFAEVFSEIGRITTNYPVAVARALPGNDNGAAAQAAA